MRMILEHRVLNNEIVFDGVAVGGGIVRFGLSLGGSRNGDNSVRKKLLSLLQVLTNFRKSPAVTVSSRTPSGQSNCHDIG